MKHIYKLLTVFAVVFLFSCEQDDSSTTSSLRNFVGFEIGPDYHSIPKDVTTNIDVVVAASEKSSSDRTYTLVVGATSTLVAPYTVPGTVTIPANSTVGTFTVSVTDNAALGFVWQQLVIDFQDEAGVDFGDPITLFFEEQCLDTKARFTFKTDNWPEETGWELYDLSGTPTVIQSAPIGTYAGAANRNVTFNVDFCLASGNYGIVIYDSYGDGIVGGTFSVTANGATLVGPVAITGSQTSAIFTIN